jgi:enoyl-CoA hydratase/carnithine racemase
MEQQDVLFERRDRVAVITLNRPGHLNTFTGAMGEGLAAAYRAMGKPDAIEGPVAWVEGRPPRWRGSVTRDWPLWPR